MITIGEAMRKARVSRGITQKQLSKLSGVNHLSISKYECGDRVPGLLTAWSIADALGMSIDTLVGRCGA